MSETTRDRTLAGGPDMHRIEQEIRRQAQRIADSSFARVRGIGALLSAYVQRPGKRVRPLLCALGHGLFVSETGSEPTTPPSAGSVDGVPSGVVSVAATLELIHAFLLIHDDIADRASTRRGLPALHVELRPRWLASPTEASHLGDSLATVAGDWLYTVALQGVLEAPGLAPELRLRVLQEVLSVCADTAQGQCMDIESGARSLSEVAVDQVDQTYLLKTGRYTVEGPLVAGALCAGASDDHVDALRQFGRPAGVAFQLLDDLVTLLLDDATTGKPALADLREGKKTYPLVRAAQMASAPDRAWLDALLSRGDANERDLLRVRDICLSSGAVATTLDAVDARCAAAGAVLMRLPQGPARSALKGWVDSLRRQAATLSMRVDLVDREIDAVAMSGGRS